MRSAHEEHIFDRHSDEVAADEVIKVSTSGASISSCHFTALLGYSGLGEELSDWFIVVKETSAVQGKLS
jgi:hypothetical protein